MLYASRLTTILGAFMVSTTLSMQLSSNPLTQCERKRSYSLPCSSRPGHLLSDLEEQLLQKNVQPRKKVTECSSCTCPSVKSIFLAGLIFSAGWVLKDIFKVVTKVDTGLESIAQKLDNIKDHLNGDHTPWCPDGRNHMEKMYQALHNCNAPTAPDQSWYIQEDLPNAQPTAVDNNVAFLSCPAAKLHFILMLKNFKQCWQANSTWFNPSEIPT